MQSATIYELKANGTGLSFKAIEPLKQCVGQKVIQDHRGQTGVICDVAPGGYFVVFSDGSSSAHQTFDSISPFTRIRPVAPLETVDQSEVERLKVVAVQYQADQRRKTEEKRVQKNQEIAKLTAQLQAEYPKAKPGKPSINLKAELKAKFPGATFAVTSSRGSSITVKYTDGPALADVEAIASKYQDGSFDGMQDLHEYDYSAYGQAFDAVCGRVKYVFVERHYSRESMEGAVEIASARQGETPLTVKTSDYDGHAYLVQDWSREHQHNAVYELLRATDFRF